MRQRYGCKMGEGERREREKNSLVVKNSKIVNDSSQNLNKIKTERNSNLKVSLTLYRDSSWKE